VTHGGKVGLAALIVPGGLVVLGAALLVLTAAAYALWSATGTGDARLEALRWRVAWQLARQLGAAVRPAHGRAMMAILSIELPDRWTPGTPVVGDVGLGGGPSIGPGQVYRATAKALGLWTPPAGLTEEEERKEYQALASDEDRLVAWSVAVFRSKLDAASGDVAEAVRRYNGSGPRAETYREKALAFAGSKWGGLEA
jgi:hypothetical protein